MNTKRKTNTENSTDTIDTLLREQASADKAYKALKEAEKNWVSSTKKLSGADWRKAVDKVKDKSVRVHAACIVWWDFFGSRAAIDRWMDLDDYRAEWREDQKVEMSKVKEALVLIGYPEHKAVARVRYAEDERCQ